MATKGVKALRVLSVIPPMTQLNTPYPSTAYLTGFLRSRGIDAVQEDLALALVLRLFSPEGLAALHERVQALPNARQTAQTRHFAAEFPRYAATVAKTIAFLQGADPTLAHRIASRGLLPEGERFASLEVYGELYPEDADPLGWAFGALGLQDRARHLATLYLNDLADVLRDAVDPRFEFVRYAEQLATSQPHFDPLAEALAAPRHLIDETLHALTLEALARHEPHVVLLSVPFPGAVYAALRIAQTIRQERPGVTIALGGGFVNTELRELAEPRLFDFVDVVTLDAGERPLLALLEHVAGERSAERLVRSFVRDQGTGQVRYLNWPEPDLPFDQTGTPTWEGLPLQQYLSLLDMLNPMNRLWSDGRWNKLTVAQGCYWKKCSFCDVTLDYISRYEAASGCIAISGGLEVASDRLLALMKKGVSVEQVARVTKGFAEAGVMVHAYLMYGFPTQTMQDTVDALEYVRQLFENGCIHSGFFHRFACTVHSPVGKQPGDYGITLLPLPEGRFAKNDVGFVDPTGTDHEALGRGLKKAIYNYMHGIGLEEDVRAWFTGVQGKIPRPTVSRQRIARALGAAGL